MPTETTEGTATIQLDARTAAHFEQALRVALLQVNSIVVVTDNIAGRRAEPQPPGREGIVTTDNLSGRGKAPPPADGIIVLEDDIAGRGGEPQPSGREIVVATVDNISGRGAAPPVPEHAAPALSIVLDAAEAARFHRILHAGLAAARTAAPGEA